MSDQREDGIQFGDWVIYVVPIGKQFQWIAVTKRASAYGELHQTREAAEEAAIRQLKGSQ
jgi:hypothetical protein